MQILLALKTIKRVFKIVTNKYFLILLGIMIFWFLSSFGILGYFIRTELLDPGEELLNASTAKASSIRELYKDALKEEGIEPDQSFGTPVPDFSPPVEVNSGGSGTPGGTENDQDYSNTVDYAESIEGSSVLHQMHNAIVAEVNKSQYPWFQYWLVLGKNMKEANGFGGSWIPHIGVDKKGIQDPNFDINTWGVNDITNFNDISKNYNNTYTGQPKAYVGPFQTSPKYYFGTDNFGISLSSWQTMVANSSSSYDGNGDGKSDPFNYLDGLKTMAYHASVKDNETKNYISFVSDQYYNEMYGMSIASRYVGISGRDSTHRFPSSEGPWTGYTHHEHLNPHIQLMRKAIEEYYNGGQYFQRFKEHLIQSKSVNGVAVQHLVNSFFNSVEGWKAVGDTETGGYLQYTYPDGTYLRYTGQNMHYPFLVFWGGKVAEDEITKILQGS